MSFLHFCFRMLHQVLRRLVWVASHRSHCWFPFASVDKVNTTVTLMLDEMKQPGTWNRWTWSRSNPEVCSENRTNQPGQPQQIASTLLHLETGTKKNQPSVRTLQALHHLVQLLWHDSVWSVFKLESLENKTQTSCVDAAVVINHVNYGNWFRTKPNQTRVVNVSRPCNCKHDRYTVCLLSSARGAFLSLRHCTFWSNNDGHTITALLSSRRVSLSFCSRGW